MIVKSLPKQQIQIVPGGSGVAAMKADYGDSLRILLAVCCLVLLIACANIANLSLALGLPAVRKPRYDWLWAHRGSVSCSKHSRKASCSPYSAASPYRGCVPRRKADRRAYLRRARILCPSMPSHRYPCWHSPLACPF